MAIRKKTPKKKPVKKTATTGGIKSYIRKIENSPKVKAATSKIKKIEMQLKAAKKTKAALKKAAQIAYRRKK
jgi:hypothetical protein